MSFDYATRARLGIVLLILVSLLSSRQLLHDAGKPRPKLWASDELSIYEKRFDTLKRLLPAHGVIGYAKDPSAEEGGIRDYYLTQYALSPLVVDYSVNHRLVIGNSRDAHANANPDLVIIQDFGNGVILYQNKTQ